MEELEQIGTSSASRGCTVTSSGNLSIPLQYPPIVHPSPPPPVTQQVFIPPLVALEFVPSHMTVEELLSQLTRKSLQILDSGGTNETHWYASGSVPHRGTLLTRWSTCGYPHIFGHRPFAGKRLKMV
ncbi:unnamed protein product [Cochlearia groenlandica]